MEENKVTEQTQGDEDLSKYITQVVTNIGKSFNSEQIKKLADKVPKTLSEINTKKMKWKMASASNAWGITPEEYSKFAIHVFKYLSYIKTLEPPLFEDLVESEKLVTIESTKLDSKCCIHLFNSTINLLFLFLSFGYGLLSTFDLKIS